jgi:Ni/Fe-hydrogenase subunit HybB-like protein
MLEKILVGDRRYWGWTLFLLAVIGVGGATYVWQQLSGVDASGMSRDVAWGFFIANYTFMVGVAASAVVVVLPYYLHDQKDFKAITALGEFLAVAAVAIAILFIMADLGQPARVFNMILHPTPNSPFFWNMIVLPGYLLLNLVIAWVTLDAERNSVAPPPWVKTLVLISIPWAISIHTLTAFVYSGLPGRPLWNSAILAPRFLASAFASGPAALILLALVVRKFTGFEPGGKAIQKLATIVTYAAIINMFFIFVEVMVAVMSGVPSDLDHFRYLYFGLDGHTGLAPWMWLSTLLGLGAIVALLMPGVRASEKALALACGAVFVSMWIDKGLCLVVGGFIPSPLAGITEYMPAPAELLIGSAVYAAGLLILTLLYKMTVAVKEESAA